MRRTIETKAFFIGKRQKNTERKTKIGGQFALCIKKRTAFVDLSENVKKEPKTSKNDYNRGGAGEGPQFAMPAPRAVSERKITVPVSRHIGKK